MSGGWTFVPSDDETGDETECEDCGRTVAPTEPCFSHRGDYLRRWEYLCTDCACVRFERGAP